MALPGGEVRTLAGSGVGSFADGLGPAAAFHYPLGVALSADGSALFVADSSNHRIRRAFPRCPLCPIFPVSPLGRNFSACAPPPRRRALSLATGAVTTLAGSGSAGGGDGPRLRATLHHPSAVAAAPDGKAIYVADCWTSRVRVVALAAGGGVSTLLGGRGGAGPSAQPAPGAADGAFEDARVAFPRGLAASADGRWLYVGDTGAARERTGSGLGADPRPRPVRRYSPDPQPRRPRPPSLPAPQATTR